MSKDQSQTIIELMNSLEDVRLREKKGGRFWFAMHMTESMEKALLEELDLSARPINILKRAGYRTVGDLVGAIRAGVDISRFRNCGGGSMREIMEHLFLFQYNSLPESQRYDYLCEVVVMNSQFT